MADKHALVVTPANAGEIDLHEFLDLKPYGADFSRVKTFQQWEYCASRIVDYGRAAGFWLLDAVEYIKGNFGYSPTTGQLLFLEEVPVHLRRAYLAPTDEAVAGWLGKSAKSVQNLRQIAKLIDDRTILAGSQVSVWDFQEILIEGLPDPERKRLAHEYAMAKQSGGYAVHKEGGKHTEMLKANRAELRARVKDSAALGNLDDNAQGGDKELERHKTWRTIRVSTMRAILDTLELPTAHLPSDFTTDDGGEIVPRYIAIEVGYSWLQEKQKK